MTGAAVEAPVVPLRRNRDFRLLWCGQVTSELGAASSQLAVPLLVLSLTGSPAQAGLVATAAAVVSAGGRLPGGALADRWNRRRLMLGSDAGRLVVSLLLAAAVLTGHATVPFVLVSVSLIALLDVVFQPAETAAIARLVPAAQLGAAFSGNEARSYAASLGGPPLGGLLYGLGRAVPFLADALSYLVSLVAVAAIRTPLQEHRPAGPRRSLLADIGQGLAHVRASRFLRALLVVAAPLNFALTGSVFTLTVTLRQAGTAAGTIGLLQALLGVGGLLGAFAAAGLTRRLPLPRLVALVCATSTVAVGAAAALSGHLLMGVPLAAALFVAPAANAGLFARLGATVPDAVQSRVVSVVLLAATSAAALAPAACGVLVTVAGGRAALLCCTAALIAALAVALTSRGLREDG